MKKLHRRRHSAFSLVEVTLAMGVAAFALVAIFGLLPVGLNSNLASINQTAATSLATRLVADLRGQSKLVGTNSVTQLYQIQLPAKGPGSTTYQTLFLREDGSVAQTGVPTSNQAINLTQNPRYRATVVFNPPPNASPKTATTARILITWPAVVDQAATTSAANMPKNYTGSFETVIALDRNFP
jgi:type II secretory pathway pseudopilin PulG